MKRSIVEIEVVQNRMARNIIKMMISLWIASVVIGLGLL